MAELLGKEIETVEVEEVSQEQIIEEIDHESRESLDMSFDEFLQACREGDLPDTLAVNELVTLLRFAGLG